MEFNEQIDIQRLKFIKSLSPKQLNNILDKNGISKKDRKSTLNQIINYVNKMIKSEGQFKHIYNYTLNQNSGRLYCGSSIQMLPKPIRGLLFPENTDYDMCNAHPTILKYLCDKHEIPAEYLDYYVNNRDDVLDDGDSDNIKKTILKSINYEKRNRKLVGYLKELDLEIKKIQKKIIKIDEYSDLIKDIPENKRYNFNGSAMSRILCFYENELLQTMIHTVNVNNLQISAPMFDGLLVDGTNDICQELEQDLNNKFPGLNMKIKIKANDDSIVFDESLINEGGSNFNEIIQYMIDNNLYNYEDTKSNFEKSHCKIIDSSIFFKERITNGDKSFITFSEGNIRISYKHMKYCFPKQDDTGQWDLKYKAFIDEWLKDDTVRCYDNVDVVAPPNKCPVNTLNLWIPFTFSNKRFDKYTHKPVELDFILNHMKILCDNDPVVTDYFIKWVAQMIQYPGIKTICPTFISKEGSGKGTFIKLLSRLMGDKKIFETTTPGRDVWGSFNNIMLNCFLVNLNELSKHETLEADGKIKALITDKALTINSKGQNAICVNSNHRFLISTNKEEPVNTSKDDRRNVIIRCSDELIGNNVYFEKINKMIEDDNVVKTFYEYLMAVPNLMEFNRFPRPITEYQQNLVSLSKQPIELFIEDLVIENIDEYEMQITTKELFDLFKIFIKNNQYNYECSYQKFNCRLFRYKYNGLTTKHSRYGNIKIFNIDILKKELNLDFRENNQTEDEQNNKIVSTNNFSFI